MNKYDKRFLYIIGSFFVSALVLVALKLCGLINVMPHYLVIVIMAVVAFIVTSLLEYKDKKKNRL
jgi:uncharacterized membrane protein (DUF106 family)